MNYPNVLIYDVEAARPLPGNEDWSRKTECGISVIASWSSQEPSPRVWLPEEGDHILDDFALHAVEHEGFVTWNGLRYDDDMITSLFPWWPEVVSRGVKIDLPVIAGLFSICCKKGLDLRTLVESLKSGVPAHYPELVGYKPTAQMNVVKGWGLKPTYLSTFSKAEPDSQITGEMAPILWSQGLKGRVITYCMEDVGKLFALWRWAFKGGSLINKNGGEAVLPQCVLGAK